MILTRKHVIEIHIYNIEEQEHEKTHTIEEALRIEPHEKTNKMLSNLVKKYDDLYYIRKTRIDKNKTSILWSIGNSLTTPIRNIGKIENGVSENYFTDINIDDLEYSYENVKRIKKWDNILKK